MPLLITITNERICQEIDAARKYVMNEELLKASAKPADLVAGIKIKKFYKDVTYETLKNKDFGDHVMKEIRDSILDGSLLHEDVMAKAGPVMS